MFTLPSCTGLEPARTLFFVSAIFNMTVMGWVGGTLAIVVVGATLIRRRLRAGKAANARVVSIQSVDQLRAAGRHAEARDILAELIKCHPRQAALHYRLACLSNGLGERQAAAESLRRACELDANWIAPARHDPELQGLSSPGAPRSRPAPAAAARDGRVLAA